MSRQSWLAVAKALNFVHPFQIVLYLLLAGWGVYSAIRPEPMAVSLMMPHPIYVLWLALHGLAPLTVWGGQFLVYIYRKPALTKQLRMGWEAQWVGDASIFFIAVTTAYAFSLSDEASANFLVPSFAGYAVLALMLSLRDGIYTIYYWGSCRRGPSNVG